ncbi:MAG: Capsular polysaccharide export system protein KpsC [uncultured Thiotrichaceae bacterium]|uniref:Capsular polysaccharide export system protein KpsC n=1 Tax=uncultured Thiotrichaceae bacterium TaxID=298394 RepID=A0A6S6TYC2_9GAMM|nr:MAG: Capsular polysaccharide export system protein KpsC [uncultured Thiotrichaceae bacterium]
MTVLVFYFYCHRLILKNAQSITDNYFSSRTISTQGTIYCFGILFITRHTIRRFLQLSDTPPIFVQSATQAIQKGFTSTDHILSWGKRGEYEAQKLSEQMSVDVWQIEDGFLRSFGLGSDFNRPASLVIDTKGIYYDPNTSSDLENILNKHPFSRKEIEHAFQFKKALAESSISKYILGDKRTLNIPTNSKKSILIPGQVEDDASIQKGTFDISTNKQLIIAVRKSNLDAYIIYKPHPDVLSGNRKGTVDENIALTYCNAIETQASIAHCLKAVDEVHTMTSLVGFEGLIHDCKVYCYGLPFYAGWGLTQDRHKCSRRNSPRSLSQLIYASYFLYPLYYDWQKNQYTNAADTLSYFTKASEKTRVAPPKSLIFQRLLKYKNVLRGFYNSLFSDIKKT